MSGAAATRSAAVAPAFWRDRSVLLTGHTGFKGAWLSLWLQSLGARVHGFSLAEPPSEPSLYQLARVGEGMASEIAGDVRDPSALARALATARPDVVIHMAAQPLVRRSYAQPRATYEINALGTVNLLDAVRATPTARAVVIVTSDKCYANRGAPRPLSEDEPLGGHDPYSSSKAAAELVASAYRDSFFAADDDDDPQAPRVATARAGNVIGGGDFGADRLIPDIVRAARAHAPLRLRNPDATRPWQHVLDPLAGYLLLSQALCASPAHARAYNFGPDPAAACTVRWVVERFAESWPDGVRWEHDAREHPHEAPHLALDSSRARAQLGWVPARGAQDAIQATVDWYRAWHQCADPRAITLAQIEAYARRA